MGISYKKIIADSANASNVSERVAKKIIDSAVAVTLQSIKAGHVVSFGAIGKFYTGVRLPRGYKNPKTGETIQRGPMRVPKVSFENGFKAYMNGGPAPLVVMDQIPEPPPAPPPPAPGPPGPVPPNFNPPAPSDQHVLLTTNGLDFAYDQNDYTRITLDIRNNSGVDWDYLDVFITQPADDLNFSPLGENILPGGLAASGRHVVQVEAFANKVDQSAGSFSVRVRGTYFTGSGVAFRPEKTINFTYTCNP